MLVCCPSSKHQTHKNLQISNEYKVKGYYQQYLNMCYRIMVLYSLWITGAIAAGLHGHSGASHLVVAAEVEDVMEIKVLNVEDVVWSHFTVYGQQGVDHEKKEEDAQRSMVDATKNYSTEKHKFIS